MNSKNTESITNLNELQTIVVTVPSESTVVTMTAKAAALFFPQDTAPAWLKSRSTLSAFRPKTLTLHRAMPYITFDDTMHGHSFLTYP